MLHIDVMKLLFPDQSNKPKTLEAIFILKQNSPQSNFTLMWKRLILNKHPIYKHAMCWREKQLAIL